jgi:hypothetical protein
METKFEASEKGIKTTDINRDGIFQKNSGVHPFLSQKK